MTKLIEKRKVRNILWKKLTNQLMTEKEKAYEPALQSCHITSPTFLSNARVITHTHTASVSAGCDSYDWTGRTSEAMGPEQG